MRPVQSEGGFDGVAMLLEKQTKLDHAGPISPAEMADFARAMHQAQPEEVVRFAPSLLTALFWFYAKSDDPAMAEPALSVLEQCIECCNR